ncbi:hypothetical protein FGSG_12347 [Fusarium graminearum PH-1]|uniref:hypothetical protein n=1 Tax=Gibberella zeae (strain ATCC MYA-4620 / CBS 123657 / FGSC 9075 / NRRL 31084 / PH-1) TaxID=229533 RepID=UPI00021F1261|nr:hypothetical protein FGSG_12347 [Fusarium graminearum PH-1]ESU09219.1 hypothetical protein FGSG_12347 [Fusarium graminearum PH-1]|eukprot:XP_011321718.1 hypothetical protein FGSG_12347 [Fusarium graminearum PH-1]
MPSSEQPNSRQCSLPHIIAQGHGYKLRSLNKHSRSTSSVVSRLREHWSESDRDDNRSAKTTALHGVGNMMVHQALPISWDASDMTALSPEPPATSSEQKIQSRETPQPWSGPREGEGPLDPIYVFLMIAVPIIVGALFTCMFCLCFWNRRKMRKERNRAQEVPLDSLPPYSNDQNPPAYAK